MKVAPVPVTQPPAPFSTERLGNAWTDLTGAAREAGLSSLLSLMEEPEAKARLAAILGNSPYLTRIMIKDPGFTERLLTESPDLLCDAIQADLLETAPSLDNTDSFMSALRRAKARIALTVAAADIWGLWPLDQVTGTLSTFAELSLDLAVAHLLKAGMVKGELAPPEGTGNPADLMAPPDLGRQSSLIVLGMGKLGARELNYSSDIDLILLFDNETVNYTGRKSPQQYFVRLARDLVRVMQERTGDGYVFRTDLRLRPDPGATPLVISVDAAEIYYQSIGLNWERAAMIKARPVAGDFDAAAGFLDRIKAFVWRKHLDFAAIEDIHAIKNQIHHHHRHGEISVAGQDVKLGRGGIREIEFFAQIHQLIAGGRERELRVPQTLKALKALADMDKISETDCRELTEAYIFLREVEHRIQMINDEQTHQIPKEPDRVAHLATFLGFASPEDFGTVLLGHLKKVQRHYDDLMEHPGGEPAREAETGISVPADATSPEMVSLLSELGYEEPERIAGIIEGWQFGRFRALRTARSRDILKGLLPHLLAVFGETTDPDSALLKFDEFLGKLPAGVQILSLFQANPWLLDVVAEIMGIAPALAEQLAKRPRLLDAVLSPDFFDPLPPLAELEADLGEALAFAQHYEDVLDICRIWVAEQKFRIGVQLIRAAVDVREAGRSFTEVAEALLSRLFKAVHTEFAKRHGTIPGSQFVIVGMGKLGGRELTFTSDIDLVFIYDVEDPDAVSDGQKSLTPGHYYTRLAQTFINAITAPTSEGTLYEVDMRLRPSGNAGPLAVSVDAFRKYQESQAWTWEHMALTRSRVCASDTSDGDRNLADKVTDTIRSILTRPRDPDELRDRVRDMRQRLWQEFGKDNIWSVKHCPGGLVDLEFICQYLILRYAHDKPELLHPSTQDSILALGNAGILDGQTTEALSAAYGLLARVQGILRLCIGKGFDPGTASSGLKAALAKGSGASDFDDLTRTLTAREKYVRDMLVQHVGTLD